MAIFYPTDDIVVSGTGIITGSVNEGDLIFIDDDISVISTGSSAISINHALSSVNVSGTVAGAFNAISLFTSVSTDVFEYFVSVGEGARLIGEAARGISLGSNFDQSMTIGNEIAVIENAGEIYSGNDMGVRIAAADIARFVNSGTIFSQGDVSFSHGVRIDATDITFDNSGSITTANIFGETVAAQIAGTHLQAFDVLEFTNSGTTAGPEFGLYVDGNTDTSEASLQNSGTISGDAFVNATTVFLNNTGTVFGDLDVDAENATVINSGQITGDLIFSVAMDDQVYRAIGDGVVIGTVQGNFTDDILIGASQDDVFNGAAGDDILRGNGGADVLNGDAGADMLDGGEGNDILDGGTGNDDLFGRDGDDELSGGNDDDFINGGEGEDLIFGDDDDDELRGGAGDDIIDGGDDDDVLVGGTGEDELIGGQGLDTLRGGDDNDILFGGLGQDILFGNAGADVFVYTNELDSTDDGNRDLIRDFTNGEDVIDLSAFAGAFTFIGSDNFSGSGGGEIRFVVNAGGNAVVRVDVDGDGNTDMRLLVQGTDTLTENDFFL